MQQKRSVQFRSIEILEFAYAVGDNPSVSNGVPLSMEWAPQMRTILPLCVFETHRPPCSRECGPRRISSRRRGKILLRNGCSMEDMITAAKDVIRIQNERDFTKYQLQTQRLMRSRRQRDTYQDPAMPPSSPSIRSTIEKPLSTDRAPMLPQRRPFLLLTPSTSGEIDFPTPLASVSPRPADKEKTYFPRLSPLVLKRQRLARMIAESSSKPATTNADWISSKNDDDKEKLPSPRLPPLMLKRPYLARMIEENSSKPAIPDADWISSKNKAKAYTVLEKVALIMEGTQ